MFVYPSQDGGKENQKSEILVRCLSGLQEIQSVELRITDDGHRPVAVLSRAVDPRERLLMKDGLQSVSQSNAAQSCHHQHVVVDGEIGFLEVRRHLELAGRDFVVPGRDRNAQLVELEFDFCDASLNALGDSTEVV